MIVRDGWYLLEEMGVEKLILLVKDHEAIFDASRCEHRNWDYIASVGVAENCKGGGRR